MKIIEDEGFCTSCGIFGEYRRGEEDYSLLSKDLDNYKKYKDVYVYKCPNCGFISSDISCEEGVLCSDVKDSYEYKQLLDYAYLKGIDKELYEYHSNDIMANYLEAYSLVLLKMKDFEKYIRAINKAIELKEVMIRKYKKSQDELGGEEENDDKYEKLYELIKESISTNRKQIDYYYDFVESKNVFLNLVYIENLIAQNKQQQAKSLFEKINKKYKLSDDLKTYIQQKLN
ncbi:MAG: hypothetical protein J6T74_07320 [Clostridia bacterium]|nr:hypothetical protein [Clostridia bacterium]